MNQVEELERAILTRAERLANEYRDRAQRSRDSILREASEKLRMREEREENQAKAQGERTYRQHVQASELKMQTHLDRMRWNLVVDVENRLADRMRIFMKDERTYYAWLERLILGAAGLIEDQTIVVAANIQDQRALYQRWDGILKALPPGKSAQLAPSTDVIPTVGGVLVTSTDGRIRIDQTFEGRLARLRPKVQQIILERLLPGGFETSTLFGG